MNYRLLHSSGHIAAIIWTYRRRARDTDMHRAHELWQLATQTAAELSATAEPSQGDMWQTILPQLNADVLGSAQGK